MRLILEFQPLLIAIEVLLVLTRGEAGEDTPQNIWIDEVVNDDVREWSCALVLRCQRATVLAAFLSIQSNIIAESGQVQHVALLQLSSAKPSAASLLPQLSKDASYDGTARLALGVSVGC